MLMKQGKAFRQFLLAWAVKVRKSVILLCNESPDYGSCYYSAEGFSTKNIEQEKLSEKLCRS